MSLTGRWTAFAAVVLFIAFVTLPWDWQDHPHWFKVSWVPLLTGLVRLRDLVANALLYLPLGLLLPAPAGRGRIAVSVVVALALSAACELTQVWSHSRFPSATDVLMNVIGAAAGAALSAASPSRARAGS